MKCALLQGVQALDSEFGSAHSYRPGRNHSNKKPRPSKFITGQSFLIINGVKSDYVRVLIHMRFRLSQTIYRYVSDISSSSPILLSSHLGPCSRNKASEEEAAVVNLQLRPASKSIITSTFLSQYSPLTSSNPRESLLRLPPLYPLLSFHLMLHPQSFDCILQSLQFNRT